MRKSFGTSMMPTIIENSRKRSMEQQERSEPAGAIHAALFFGGRWGIAALSILLCAAGAAGVKLASLILPTATFRFSAIPLSPPFWKGRSCSSLPACSI